jgi:hypothetical protein
MYLRKKVDDESTEVKAKPLKKSRKDRWIEKKTSLSELSNSNERNTSCVSKK